MKFRVLNLMKKVVFALVLIVYLFISLCAYAQTPQIFYDTYTDFNYIDTGKTTANVDTTKITGSDIGAVNLPFYIYPGILKVRDNKDIVVVNGNGISTYSFDGTQMVENPLLHINVTNPLSISLLNGYDVSVMTSTGVTTYSFDGSSMLQNPFYLLQDLTILLI